MPMPYYFELKIRGLTEDLFISSSLVLFYLFFTPTFLLLTPFLSEYILVCLTFFLPHRVFPLVASHPGLQNTESYS